jgi:hypothetical protein
VAELTAVYAAYETRIDAVRAQAAAFVAEVWNGLGSWYDADIERFIAAVLPVMEGAQAATATLVAAELAAVEAVAMGTAEVVIDLTGLSTTVALRGVPGVEVWRRPAVETWTRLSHGDPLAGAVETGAARADELAATNLQLAKTHTARAWGEADHRVVGYRRVLKGRSCGRCTAAASQRYHRKNLLPIHTRCDCGVEPIYGDRDPGQVIDVKTLPGDEDDTRPGEVAVHHHGEVGPVLTEKGHDFTGPAAVPDTPAPSKSVARSRALPAGTDATDPRVQALLNL